MDFEQLTFSIPELLSLLGVAQCVYLLVYIAFRSGDFARAVLPFLYFLVLGCGFFLDFAAPSISELSAHYSYYQWAMWFLGPPLSVLLVIQIARISRVPSFGNYWVLALVPIAFMVALMFAGKDESCNFPHSCDLLNEWLVITGLIAGALSMVTIWLNRGLLDNIYKEKAGKDRYWLVMTLVTVNLIFLLLMLSSVGGLIDANGVMLIKTILGLSLGYLAGTSLFRIYPTAVTIVNRGGHDADDMTDEEKALAIRIEGLLDLEKVYQEPAYSRAELARELQAPENVVSKVINAHFDKSFPQLLNERRVEDAKRMLAQTDVSVKVIASEVGFNSTASFNRVFRDMAGETPSAYRKKNKA